MKKHYILEGFGNKQKKKKKITMFRKITNQLF